MSYLLDKNRIRSMKDRAVAKHRESHCDSCDQLVTPRDVVSVPEPGRVRCQRCTFEQSPTKRFVRVPPPCGRVA